MNQPKLTLPPLFHSHPVKDPTDPFVKACAEATLGCDSGLVVYNVQTHILRAAIVFAPEVMLEDAMSALCVCGVGFQSALGALAPPEVAVHLSWSGDILVNELLCGRLRIAAATEEPTTVPDWLVVGLELSLMPLYLQSPMDTFPADNPYQSSLSEEGCAELDPFSLLENWVRHNLVWLNRWLDEGVEPVQAQWRSLVKSIGENIKLNGREGIFLGVDDRFGLLLRTGEITHLLPLSTCLEKS